MSLGNWGQNLLNGAASTLLGSPYLRDYTHASKTFRTNSYENAPKLKFLFHTYFEFNTAAYSTAPNFGILVKEVKLPSFTMQTEALNQYNRKRIVQTKIRYDPVEITFHDDNGNNTTSMWEAYYTYYYNDGTKPGQVLRGNRGNNRFFQETDGSIVDYNSNNIYTESNGGDDHGWGLSGGATNSNLTKIPFFKNITIFGLNQHNFIAYTLINPMITNFAHDQYSYSEGSGIMQNRMTIDYETVVYNEGALDGRNPEDIVTGFGDVATYDRTTSPNMSPGANGTILGRGGLVDAAGGAIKSLKDGNVVGAIRNANAVYNGIKNPNLIESAAFELGSMLADTITNTPSNRNRNLLNSFPGASQSPGLSGLAGSPTIDARRAPQPILSEPTAGAQFSGNEVKPGFPVEAPFGGNFNVGGEAPV
jgi:hypothetical protein